MDELWPLSWVQDMLDAPFQDLDAFFNQQVDEPAFNERTITPFLQYSVDTTESFNDQHLSFDPPTFQQWEPESIVDLWNLQDATNPTQWEPRNLIGLEEPQELSTRNSIGYSDRSELSPQPLVANMVERKVVKGKKETCIPCWALKRKCEGGQPCARCLGFSTPLPRHFCLRVRFADEPIFIKWMDPTYSKQLQWESLRLTSTPKQVLLAHEPDGPALPIDCAEFEPTAEDEMRVFWKEESGWKWIQTTAFCLANPVDLDQYISSCARFYLERAGHGDGLLAQVFRMAQIFNKAPLITHSLNLWTATQLLMKGWIMRGKENLGMAVVNEQGSPLNGTMPVPRVLQNQLDHKLEQEVIKTEYKLLKELQRVMRQRNRHQWIVVFVAVVIVLHVLERDTWRLLYWVHRPKQIYAWRHPSRPITLIEKSVYFSKLLLAHFRSTFAGMVPMNLDWTDRKTEALLNDDHRAVDAMKKLQEHIKNLRNSSSVPQKGCDRYQSRDESSLDFTLSSFPLMESKDTFEMKDFVKE